MNKLLYVLILILLSISVISFESNKEIVVSKIESCYDLTVKIIPEPLEQINNIKVINCNHKSSYIWKCNCNGEYTLKVIGDENANAVYNFGLQYNTEKPILNKELNYTDSQYNNYLHTIKRIKNINGIQIGNIKESFNLFNFLQSEKEPNGNEVTFILIVIIIIIIIIIIGVIIFALYFLKNESEDNDKNFDIENELRNL